MSETMLNESPECQVSMVNPGRGGYSPVLPLDHLDERARDDLLFELFMGAAATNADRPRLKVPNRPGPSAFQFRKSKSGGRYTSAWHRVRAHLLRLTTRALDDLYSEHGMLLDRKDLIQGLGMYAEDRLRPLIRIQQAGESPPTAYFRWAYIASYDALDRAIELAADEAMGSWSPKAERQERKLRNLVLGQQATRSNTKNTEANAAALRLLRAQHPGLAGVEEAERIGVSLRTLRRISNRVRESDGVRVHERESAPHQSPD